MFKLRMKKIVIVAILLNILTLISAPEYGVAFAVGSCGKNCQSCHTLTKDEAQIFLKAFDPNVTVTGVTQSPSKGLWEITFNVNKDKSIGYLDFGKENLIVGNIIRLKTKQNLTRERMLELQFKDAPKVDTSKIPLDDAIVIGDPKAVHKVIVFDDPECPFCAKLHEEIKHVITIRPDIVFYIKMFPLISIHKDSYRKSRAIVCKKSLKLLDDAFAKRPIPDPDCNTKAVDETLRLVDSLGIGSTPTLILPDGRVIKSYLDSNEMQKLIPKNGEVVTSSANGKE